MGGSEKIQKYAGVIKGWSLTDEDLLTLMTAKTNHDAHHNTGSLKVNLIFGHPVCVYFVLPRAFSRIFLRNCGGYTGT